MSFSYHPQFHYDQELALDCKQNFDFTFCLYVYPSHMSLSILPRVDGCEGSFQLSISHLASNKRTQIKVWSIIGSDSTAFQLNFRLLVRLRGYMTM